MNRRGMGAFLLLLPFSTAGAVALFAGRNVSAEANSAPPFWEGADSTGSILTDDKCPVEVVKEKLKIEVGEVRTDADSDPIAVYRGAVEAEYTFKNPTQAPLDVTLAFPFGCMPEYAFRDKDYNDASLYSIKADGEDIAYQIRNSYNRGTVYGRDFDIDEGLACLYAPREDGIFRTETPLYVINYEIDLSNAKYEKDWDWANFSVTFRCDHRTTHVFSANGGNMSINDGYAKYSYGFNLPQGQDVITLYSLGGRIDPIEAKVARFDFGRETKVEGAVVREGKSSETTFGEFIESMRGEESEISEEDWFNAYVDLLNASRDAECSCLSTASIGPNVMEGRLMRWFEYRLTIGAGESVVNTVRAPIYPQVDFSGSDNVYTYTYLLSPAQKWAKFGGIDIEVDTPYYLFNSTLTFGKEEGKYTLSREELPLGELVFSLSASEPPAKNFYSPYRDDNESLIVAIVLVSLLAAAGITVTVVLVVRSNRRKKQRKEEEKRLLLGRTEEGQVDLPPVPPASSDPSDPPVPPDPDKKE